MQLILNSEADIDIKRKMSVIEQETFDETFKDKSVTHDLNNEFPNINEDTIELNVQEDCIEKGNVIETREDIDIKSPTITNCDVNTAEGKVTESDIDQKLTQIISKESNSNGLNNQSQDSQTFKEDPENIETMEVEQSEDIEQIEENSKDVEMIDLQTKEIRSNCQQLKKENNEIVKKIDVVIANNMEEQNNENITKQQSNILQENTDVTEPVPLDTESGGLETDSLDNVVPNSSALKPDSDELKPNEDLELDLDDSKPISSVQISDSDNLKPDPNYLKPDSNDMEPIYGDLNCEYVDLKPDSGEAKHESNNLKLDSSSLDLKLDFDDLKSDTGCEKKPITNGLSNDKVIDMLDGKEKCNTIVSVNDNENSTDIESEKVKACADSETVKENDELESNVKDAIQIDEHPLEKIASDDKGISETIVQNTESLEDEVDKNTEKDLRNNKQDDSKKLSLICKLSNTLDILSDEEEDLSPSKESQKKEDTVKQCIQIEDDDDIMLIDEDVSNTKAENKLETSKEIPTVVNEVKQTNDELKEELPQEKDTTDENNKDTIDVSLTTETDLTNQNQEKNPTDIPQLPKSLLPVTFLKTCKKNLVDMTRNELEEFCILKIVESVVDRSNLSEIKTQLKVMAQSIEEYKKKAMMLTKQNRDLQVVLKSVQEEQKKRTDLPITPLKITRSVGMQVFMTDKTVARRKSTLGPINIASNVPGNSPANKQNKGLTNQSPKAQKHQANANNVQQIPVPRLVPASNSTNNSKVQTPITNVTAKTPVTPTTPNGVKNSPPIQKAAKRSISKMGSSITVDLTDDEPPAKVVQLNSNPPVRLVPPQNLLAPQRQPFGATMNSPRKVYIPISGSQNQVRPGQTFMLKPIVPQGPRQRTALLRKQNPSPLQMTRIASRHPAPLPDCMKQYQPPNWKSLPPAPELKLSKVENGIVISWKIDGYQDDNHEEIASYQLYAYQETSSPPSTALWKKIGDVKALPLPMACTLTQFMTGYKYYFAVRAVDIRSRLGPFSAPGSILLLNKM